MINFIGSNWHLIVENKLMHCWLTLVQLLRNGVSSAKDYLWSVQCTAQKSSLNLQRLFSHLGQILKRCLSSKQLACTHLNCHQLSIKVHYPRILRSWCPLVYEVWKYLKIRNLPGIARGLKQELDLGNRYGGVNLRTLSLCQSSLPLMLCLSKSFRSNLNDFVRTILWYHR